MATALSGRAANMQRTLRCASRLQGSLGSSAASRSMSVVASRAARSQSRLCRKESMLPFPPAVRLFATSSSLHEDLQRTPAPSADGANVEGGASKAERTRKRFWKNVDVAYVEASPASPTAHLLVKLDGRSLRTPSGAILAIPTSRPLLASLIAREWAEQDKIIHQHSLPMTSIAARAIDGMQTEAERRDIVDALLDYLQTETICFHESHPPNLVKLQEERWLPILEWIQARFGTPPIKVFKDIFDVEQDPNVIEHLRRHVQTYDGFDLAAFERVVRTTKSFLIGVRLIEALRAQSPQEEAAFGATEAALAAEVEVESQTQRWGQVEDTHDVDHADLRKTLASAACALVRDSDEVARQIAKPDQSPSARK